MTAVEPGAAEAPVVAALRKLSVFTADQAGAYREHFSGLSAVLGDDVKTKLAAWLEQWAADGRPGTVVLTGNAGTGKTAAAEAYCAAAGGLLPQGDTLEEVAPGRWVLKDLSGVATPAGRREVLTAALDHGNSAQSLVCANEGILRDALGDAGDSASATVLDRALRSGAAAEAGLTVVNVNRQRPTSPLLWDRLLDYLTRERLWTGCEGCPFGEGGCAMRANAEQLRRGDVRGQLRSLFRLGAGEAVPTLREVLAILSWALVGDTHCGQVKSDFRDRGRQSSTASEAYFSRLLGGGLSTEAADRSPLMAGLKGSGLGQVSDLEVDGWLRDSTGAPPEVLALAGAPEPGGDDNSAGSAGQARALAGSRSPLDRVKTRQQPMTFCALGEMISTSEDPPKVEDGLRALVDGDETSPSAQALWRRRVYLEASADLGGPDRSARRLLRFRHAQNLADLAAAVASGQDTVLQAAELVRGLNFLVTGFPSADEGMIVPDPACLFSRDPGAFRPASPSLVHSLVHKSRLSLSVPDTGLVEEILDIDHVDVLLSVDGTAGLQLRIGPRMYEAICEAADYGGPVGQGVAEMNDLRSFYGRLASEEQDTALRVADPASRPLALLPVTLPHVGVR